jgi:hypothetical protein
MLAGLQRRERNLEVVPSRRRYNNSIDFLVRNKGFPALFDRNGLMPQGCAPLGSWRIIRD